MFPDLRSFIDRLRRDDDIVTVDAPAGADRTKTRAHVAYQVSDLRPWRAKVTEAGYTTKEQPLIPGYDRFQFREELSSLEIPYRLHNVAKGSAKRAELVARRALADTEGRLGLTSRDARSGGRA